MNSNPAIQRLPSGDVDIALPDEPGRQGGPAYPAPHTHMRATGAGTDVRPELAADIAPYPS